MLPHFFLRRVERHGLQSACTAGVTAAKVRGIEALDACSGGYVGKADLQVAIPPGEVTRMASWATESFYKFILRVNCQIHGQRGGWPEPSLPLASMRVT